MSVKKKKTVKKKKIAGKKMKKAPKRKPRREYNTGPATEARRLRPDQRRARIKVGQNLRAAREDMRLSQRIFAKKAGFTQPMCSRIEHGLARIPVNRMAAIEKLLKIADLRLHESGEAACE